MALTRRVNCTYLSEILLHKPGRQNIFKVYNILAALSKEHLDAQSMWLNSISKIHWSWKRSSMRCQRLHQVLCQTIMSSRTSQTPKRNGNWKAERLLYKSKLHIIAYAFLIMIDPIFSLWLSLLEWGVMMMQILLYLTVSIRAGWGLFSLIFHTRRSFELAKSTKGLNYLRKKAKRVHVGESKLEWSLEMAMMEITMQARGSGKQEAYRNTIAFSWDGNTVNNVQQNFKVVFYRSNRSFPTFFSLATTSQ